MAEAVSCTGLFPVVHWRHSGSTLDPLRGRRSFFPIPKRDTHRGDLADSPSVVSTTLIHLPGNPAAGIDAFDNDPTVGVGERPMKTTTNELGFVETSGIPCTPCPAKSRTEFQRSFLLQSRTEGSSSHARNLAAVATPLDSEPMDVQRASGGRNFRKMF